MILSFRRVGVPLAAGLPFMIGTTMTAAFAVIAYGAVNLFSLSFAVLLLGLAVLVGRRRSPVKGSRLTTGHKT